MSYNSNESANQKKFRLLDCFGRGEEAKNGKNHVVVSSTKDDKQPKISSQTQRDNKVNESRKKLRKPFLFFISLANMMIGVSSISIGLAAFYEGKSLQHWLTKSGFNIWYGCLVCANGISGLACALKKSSIRGHIHLWLNTITTVSTVLSFAFYIKALSHYIDVIKGKSIQGCKSTAITPNNNDCIHLAKVLAALHGVLFMIGVVELTISLVLCGNSSIFRNGCVKYMSTENDNLYPYFVYDVGPVYAASAVYSLYIDDSAHGSGETSSHIHQKTKGNNKAGNKDVHTKQNTTTQYSESAPLPGKQKNLKKKTLDAINESAEDSESDSEAPATEAGILETQQRNLELGSVV